MNLVYFALGALLLVLVVVDLLWTTLWVEGGAGPLTSRLMSWSWRTLRKLAGQNSRVLSLSGPLVFVVGLSVWIALLWSGWTLIYASVDGALVDTLNRGAVSWADLLYFTGYTMFTLGNGDFVPGSGIWQLTTILATGSGMLFVTLTVTYILSVLDAVTQKRAFAMGVSGFGTRGTEIVRKGWTGEEFRGLDLPLNTYVSQVNTLTSNHKAYPVLHYFHTPRAEQAPTIGVAVLDEALTLFRFGVPQQDRPDEVVIDNARSGVHTYLQTLETAFVEPADRTPPSPDLDALREAGVPTVSDDEFAASLAELDDRRRMLLGLVESDARQWPSAGDTE
ncbi:Ion channel [Halopelagius inordinatus]|uniref:Ion channel n=1 Tax=Halopelagius inordinatus TaxID=553467 RepID=A0A1I2RFW0_9EURY|nr:potassium channel family protein [Halopelagius inordinatus]SFG36666.1 Ion channel [Halopelagius inordinatus]